MAIGSGGLFGKGVHGIEVYVPVRESDMVFTFIGEAWGFVGSATVVFLYFYLFYQVLVAVCGAIRVSVCTSVSPLFFRWSFKRWRISVR